MGKWAFPILFTIFTMIHISSVQSPHMSRFIIKYKINKICAPLACTCPILVPDGPVLFCFFFVCLFVLKECVWLRLEPVSYTYHSLKLEDRALCPLELCTTEAGDSVVLLWVSVVGDTRPGGVDDS